MLVRKFGRKIRKVINGSYEDIGVAFSMLKRRFADRSIVDECSGECGGMTQEAPEPKAVQPGEVLPESSQSAEPAQPIEASADEEEPETIRPINIVKRE
jgi:hypothetical protein